MNTNEIYVKKVIQPLEEKIKEQRIKVFETNNKREKELLVKYEKLLFSKYKQLEKMIKEEIN